MYKITLIFSFLCFGLTSLIAQETYLAKFSAPSNEKRIEVYLTDATLSISGTNSKEVKVTASGKEPLPERARGLRPISKIATDNTGLGLEVLESNNTITIRQTASSELSVNLQIPLSANLLLDHSGRNDEAITIKDVRGEMELSVRSTDLQITGVTGPIVANNTRGNIEVKFTQLSQVGPTSINTVSGFVDVTLPANTKATFEMTTLSDEVFTDFDLKKIESDDSNRRKDNNYDCRCNEQNILGTINGGGVEVYLKSVRDNIYLRKG